MISRLAAALAVLLGACGGGDDDPTDDPDADVTQPDAPPGVDTNPGQPGLSGLLIDHTGAPLIVTDVLACMATTCLYGESDGEGRFEFDIDPPAEVALKTHADLARNPRLAAALEPVRIVAGGGRVDVQTLYMPDLAVGTVLAPESEDPQTVAAGDGLELTLNRADLMVPIGDFLYDVAARKLPAEHVPSYPELAGQEVLAVYALHPFATKSSSPIGVSVPIDLPDGTAVEVRWVSEIDGLASAPIPAEVNGGVAVTAPGMGIARLTYLLVSRP